MSTSVFAADQGHGKVTFKGEIVDAPCSISSDSIDQTVYLGEVSNSVLANGGSSSSKIFNIELEDCVLSDDAGVNNKVEITFSGASAAFDSKLLGVTGLKDEKTSGNVGILINDSNGVPVEMGLSTAQDHQLQAGNNTLKYSARLVGASVDVSEIPLGKFEAVTNFTLQYN